MGKQSFFDALKERIGGFAFDVFCWSIGMTGEEYITALSGEAVRGYIEAAEQSLHLTDGSLRDLLANPTPKQLSALKNLLTPPIGR